MEFFSKIEASEIDRLGTEKNRIVQQQRTRIVGKGYRDNERVQEYRPIQEGRKQMEKLNILIYNKFFDYCDIIGTTQLQVFPQNNRESWLNNVTEGYGQDSYVKQDKCPTDVLRMFRRHAGINSVRLKQTTKLICMAESTMSRRQAIKKIEKMRQDVSL